jgi:integrase
MTLREHANAWLQYVARFRAETTATRYTAGLKSFLEAFGDTEADALTVEALRVWHGERADALMVNTLAVETVVVKRLLREAKCPDLSDTLELPRKQKGKRSLGTTWAKVRAALKDSPEPERSALLFLLNTGLRSGEFLHLRPQDVKGKTIEIRAHNGWKPKSSASVRTIRKSKEASKCLRKLKGEPYICGDLTRDRLAKALEKACERAGLPRLTPHKLRALFLTSLCERGVHVEVARRLAGHANIAVTQGYFKLEQKALDDVMEKF